MFFVEEVPRPKLLRQTIASNSVVEAKVVPTEVAEVEVEDVVIRKTFSKTSAI